MAVLALLELLATAPGAPPDSRRYLLLLMVLTLGVVAAFTGLLAIGVVRKNRRLRALREDTDRRRAQERDAWTESARRIETPTPAELRARIEGDEPESAGDADDRPDADDPPGRER